MSTPTPTSVAPTEAPSSTTSTAFLIGAGFVMGGALIFFALLIVACRYAISRTSPEGREAARQKAIAEVEEKRRREEAAAKKEAKKRRRKERQERLAAEANDNGVVSPTDGDAPRDLERGFEPEDLEGLDGADGPDGERAPYAPPPLPQQQQGDVLPEGEQRPGERDLAQVMAAARRAKYDSSSDSDGWGGAHPDHPALLDMDEEADAAMAVSFARPPRRRRERETLLVPPPRTELLEADQRTLAERRMLVPSRPADPITEGLARNARTVGGAVPAQLLDPRSRPVSLHRLVSAPAVRVPPHELAAAAAREAVGAPALEWDAAEQQFRMVGAHERRRRAEADRRVLRERDQRCAEEALPKDPPLPTIHAVEAPQRPLSHAPRDAVRAGRVTAVSVDEFRGSVDVTLL